MQSTGELQGVAENIVSSSLFHVTLKDCIQLQGGSFLLKKEQLFQQQLVGVTFSEVACKILSFPANLILEGLAKR